MLAALGTELRDAAVVSVISEKVAVLAVNGVKGGHILSVETLLSEKSVGGCRFSVDAFRAERDASEWIVVVDVVRAESNERRAELPPCGMSDCRSLGGGDIDRAVRNLGDGDIITVGGTVALNDVAFRMGGADGVVAFDAGVMA